MSAFAAACLILAGAPICARAAFYLQSGGRVLVCGDPGIALLDTYVATRFPAVEAVFDYPAGPCTAAAAPREGVLLLADPAPPEALEALVKDRPALRVTAPGKDDVPPLDRLLFVRFPPAAGMPPSDVPIASARAILERWDAPRLVSSVVIDALNGAATAENSSVLNVDADRVVAWSQDDQALPLPYDYLDPATGVTPVAAAFVQAFNRQMLQVRGLPSWRYSLTIDGKTIATFTRPELDQGVNLALLRTPMLTQASEVYALTLELHQLRRERAQAGPDAPSLSSRIDELDALRRARAKPVRRDYELLPIEQ